MAVLFVSHDLALVRAISSRIVVMHDGRLLEERPTEQLFEAPGDAHAAQLVATARWP